MNSYEHEMNTLTRDWMIESKRATKDQEWVVQLGGSGSVYSLMPVNMTHSDFDKVGEILEISTFMGMPLLDLFALLCECLTNFTITTLKGEEVCA